MGVRIAHHHTGLTAPQVLPLDSAGAGAIRACSDALPTGSWQHAGMPGAHDLPPLNLQALPPEAASWVARWQPVEQQLALRELALVDRDRELDQARTLLQRKDSDIAWRDAKIEKITFELARLKRWKFGVSSEAMEADQRRLFEETLVEDEASLHTQLEQLRLQATGDDDKAKLLVPMQS